jgi:hypothetical protein
MEGCGLRWAEPRYERAYEQFNHLTPIQTDIL